MATIDNLPCDALTNIVIRLPTKQLAQMRCISVPFNALLSHTTFIESHLKLIHIWNPSLSAVITLPPYTVSRSFLPENYFRFGYDPKTDDYNVVKITFNRSNVVASEFISTDMIAEWLQVEVYSMQNDTWNLITKNVPLDDFGDVCLDGTNGHLHWLSYLGSEKKHVIVAYNLGLNTFSEIAIPVSVQETSHIYSAHVGVLNGQVCLMRSHLGTDFLEVWVMDTGVALYDPNETEYMTFDITRHFKSTKVVRYVDSLVWVAPAKRSINIGSLKCENRL
ncbi:F-box/kelch-repeat protein At3g06240-like [Rutidosis leptorrhynchoides]|uniref:F-box/kelch-repeat protein At3g06240-like n=1 Tax=Rutidosis leptorrhynchoides TaxID=125765 RepID=UPI003A9904AB